MYNVLLIHEQRNGKDIEGNSLGLHSVIFRHFSGKATETDLNEYSPYSVQD